MATQKTSEETEQEMDQEWKEIQQDCQKFGQQMEEEGEGTTINDMNLSLITEIISRVDFPDAMNCAKVCKFMRSAYWNHRNAMPGPKCEASAVYKSGTISFIFQYYGVDSLGRAVSVSLDKWSKYFKNSTCVNFYLELDEELPENLVDKVFCCKSIQHLSIAGKSVNQKMIEKIDMLATVTEINVEKWRSGMKSPRSMNSLKIFGKETSFKDMILVIPNLEYLIMTMTLDDFKNTCHFLERLGENLLSIRQWKIKLDDKWDRKLSEQFFNRFVAVIAHIAKTTLKIEMEHSTIFISEKKSYGYEAWLQPRPDEPAVMLEIEQIRNRRVYLHNPYEGEIPRYNPNIRYYGRLDHY